MENTATMEQGAPMMTTMGNLAVTDVSGQRHMRVNSVPLDSTVGDLLKSLVDRMQIDRNGSNGTSRTFKLFLKSAGRHLGAHEVVRDTLRSGDEVSIHPSVVAG